MTQSKSTRYEILKQEIQSILGLEGKYSADIIGNMALFCALIIRQFPEFIFTGFYLMRDGQLHIGPYQGAIIACTPIGLGKGVCGTAAAKQRTVIVDDVEEFPGYIACDSDTRSEIVLPLIRDNSLIAVLDIDHPDPGFFNTEDQQYLEELLSLAFGTTTH